MLRRSACGKSCQLVDPCRPKTFSHRGLKLLRQACYSKVAIDNTTTSAFFYRQQTLQIVHHGGTAQPRHARYATVSTNSSHASPNRPRSAKTRHDAPAIPSLATPADRSRRQESGNDGRAIHQQPQTTSNRKPPAAAADGSATGRSTTERPTASPRPDWPTSAHNARTARPKINSRCEMAAWPRSKIEDMHPKRPAQRHVQKYVPPPKTPFSPDIPPPNQPTDPLILTQSNAPSAPSNPRPTPPPAKRTPSSPP